MLNADWLRELSQQIQKILPHGSEAKSEIDSQIRQIISSSLAKLDLVTREEFDVQAKRLERLQQQALELERKLATLQNNDQT